MTLICEGTCNSALARVDEWVNACYLKEGSRRQAGGLWGYVGVGDAALWEAQRGLKYTLHAPTRGSEQQFKCVECGHVRWFGRREL